MGVTSTFEGEKEFFDFLRQLQDESERQELFDNIGAYGVSSTQQRIIEAKGPDGAAWQKSRRALLTGGQTLRQSGRLYMSLAHRASSRMVEWGSNLIYAGIHHFGGIIRAKNKKALAFRSLNGNLTMVKQVTIPARPYVGISAFDAERISGTARDWVLGMIKP